LSYTLPNTDETIEEQSPLLTTSSQPIFLDLKPPKLACLCMEFLKKKSQEAIQEFWKMGCFFSSPVLPQRISIAERFEDKELLCNLLICATHDSGAYKSRNMLAKWINTQSNSITGISF
jgi:hypothetical protein